MRYPTNQQRKSVYRPITAKDRDAMKQMTEELRAKLSQRELKLK